MRVKVVQGEGVGGAPSKPSLCAAYIIQHAPDRAYITMRLMQWAMCSNVRPLSIICLLPLVEAMGCGEVLDTAAPLSGAAACAEHLSSSSHTDDASRAATCRGGLVAILMGLLSSAAACFLLKCVSLYLAMCLSDSPQLLHSQVGRSAEKIFNCLSTVIHRDL
jgi:hypothetical protein